MSALESNFQIEEVVYGMWTKGVELPRNGEIRWVA